MDDKADLTRLTAGGLIVALTHAELERIKRFEREDERSKQVAIYEARMDTLTALHNYQNLQVQIDSWAWYSEPYLREAFKDGIDETYTAAFTALIRESSRIGISLEAIEPGSTKIAGQRAEGIRRILTGQDNGEYLRQVLGRVPGLTSDMARLRATLTKDAGAPEGMRGWRQTLAKRLIALKDQYSENSLQAAGRYMRELKEKAALDDDEQIILGSFEKWSKNRDTFRKRLNAAIADYIATVRK